MSTEPDGSRLPRHGERFSPIPKGNVDGADKSIKLVYKRNEVVSPNASFIVEWGYCREIPMSFERDSKMADFDEIKRQAEKWLGPEEVREFEKKADLLVSRCEDDAHQLVHVEEVTFRPTEPEATHDSRSANNSSSAPSAVSASESLIASAIRGEYLYGNLGLILGLATIIGGIILGLHGVAGSTSWTASLFELHSEINDAAPGVVLFVVGIFLVFITRPKVKLKHLKG